MKFPKHIILDISKSNISYSPQYWIFKYIFSEKKKINILDSVSFHRNFFFKKEGLLPSKIRKNQKKFTVRYSHSNPALFFSKKENDFAVKVFAPRPKVKNKLRDSLHYGKEVYDFFKKPAPLFNEKRLRRLFRSFSYNTPSYLFKTSNLWSLFDIHFLRKERIYTKLKYSRVPQYDIVSGGAAALLAGFLGFLICEKFGFELLDSGDFYYLFMYAVFFFFFLRLYLKLINGLQSHWNVFSIKWFLLFFKTLFVLFSKFIRRVLKL